MDCAKKNTSVRMIEVAGLITASASDGPGIRSVLFLQGCSRLCPGCHNKSYQLRGQGIPLAIDKLVGEIEVKCRNKKITISGGEPLEQLEPLTDLIDKLAAKGFNICLYTGYDFESVPKFLLERIHYLKTGSYMEMHSQHLKPYVGSSNQQMYRITIGDKETCSIEI